MLLGTLLLMSGAPTARAEKEGHAGQTVTTKAITGEADFISPTLINVVYARDKKAGHEDEMALPYDAQLKMTNVRSLSEVKRGSQVMVTYDETSWTDDGGMERKSRKATEVVLLRSPIQGLRSQE